MQQPLVVPTQPNVCWSLDFMSDALTDGRRFRTLNVVEDYNCQLLGVEIDFSARRPGRVGADVVDRMPRQPGQLRTDNGPELIRARLTEWCEAQGSVLHWIQLGKPTQNAHVERFNGFFCREVREA